MFGWVKLAVDLPQIMSQGSNVATRLIVLRSFIDIHRSTNAEFNNLTTVYIAIVTAVYT